MTSEIRIVEHVQQAIDDGNPVVALESTVIAHGLPHPLNLETALECEEVVRQHGATPATIGIVAGIPTIGLSSNEIETFATTGVKGRESVEKVGLNNLAAVMSKGGWGATTVAASLRIARAAGIRVFSTGGIGGVHRGAVDSFDISADLTALSRTPIICVCAGAKAILDLPKTVERLETLGIPVIGYRTSEFPGFYSRGTGLSVDVSVQEAIEAGEIAECHFRIGGETAVLVCVPVPSEFEIPPGDIETAIEEASAQAASRGVRGKSLTPFLLAELERLAGSRTLSTNRTLLINNAKVAAEIASTLSRKSAERTS